MVYTSVTLYKTKYSEHTAIFEFNNTQKYDDFKLLCEWFKKKSTISGKKLDFMAGDAPITDEINLLKSYCYTFEEDTYTIELAKEEIKGRLRVILGLEPVETLYNFNHLLTTEKTQKLLELIKYKKTM